MKNENENTRYAGLGGDPSEYETQINPDSKVKYERTSDGSGNSVFNTLKTYIPAKTAKTMVQSDTAVKPTPNEEDLKQQDENSKIIFKNNEILEFLNSIEQPIISIEKILVDKKTN